MPGKKKTQLAAGAGGRSAPAHKKPGPSVKDDKVYEAVRDQGESKEKAARIANAGANSSRSTVGKKGGKAGSYDDWTVSDLRERAKQLGLSGYSGKKKSELVSLLRHH
jgi:Rho termination factor, N-terminal domain